MRKCAANIVTGEMLRRGDRLHRVRSVARVNLTGLTVKFAIQGERVEVPIIDIDTVQVWCDDGTQHSLTATEIVETL